MNCKQADELIERLEELAGIEVTTNQSLEVLAMNHQDCIKACVEQHHLMTRRGCEHWRIKDGIITRILHGYNDKIFTEAEFLECFKNRICCTKTWLEESERLLAELTPGHSLKERNAYLATKRDLLREHRGEFAAIYEGRLIATDKNKGRLIARVQKELGHVRAYIQKIEPDEPQVRLREFDL